MSKGLERLSSIRQQIPEDKTVTMVGGAFDMLHPGHLHVIDYAKKLGDVLVVSVLSDQHVRSYKGEQRPIIPEDHRLKMVESLKSVDHAFIPEAASYNLDNLRVLKPKHLVFGKENDEDEERLKKIEAQKASIRAEFPDIDFHDLERFPDESVSTSALIQKIKNL